MKLMKNIMDDNKEAVFKMVNALGIKLDSDEKELTRKNLIKAIFMKWLNAGEVLMEMIVKKLPSPL